MSKEDWDRFLAELIENGQGEVVDYWKKEEEEVAKKLEAAMKTVIEKISVANVAQTLQDAADEHRLVVYYRSDGKPIIH